MERFEEKAEKIYAQLREKETKETQGLIPDAQEMVRPRGPELLIPSSVFCSFFCVEGTDLKRKKTLKDTIVSFKDDLSGVDLSTLDLRGAETDLNGANLSGLPLHGSQQHNRSHARSN